MNWLVETQVPVYIPMRIPENLDYTALLETKRKSAADRSAKKKVDTPSAAAEKPAALSSNTPTQFLSKRPIVYPDASDDWHVETEEPGFDEMKEVGDLALSGECKKFKYQNPDIYVPLHVVNPKVISYLRASGLLWTGYMCDNKMFRIDPTAVDSFRREKKVGKDDPKPADDAPKVYEPVFKFTKKAVQVRADLKQEVTLDVTLLPESLKWFGITDPVAQMHVLPFLAACTPAVARTWINGRFSANKTDSSDPNKFTYVYVFSFIAFSAELTSFLVG